MRRLLPALVLGLLLVPIVAKATVPADTPLKAGTYEIVNIPATGQGAILCLVKITPKDNGVEGELVAAASNQSGLSVTGVKLEGDTLHVNLHRGSVDYSFEGQVPKTDAETVRGSILSDGKLSAARVAFTDKTELGSTSASTTELNAIRQNVTQLKQAAQRNTEEAQVRKLAGEMMTAAKPFGSRYEADVMAQVAEALATQKSFASIAREFAQKAESAPATKGWQEHQLRALNALAAASRTAGQDADAAVAESRAAALITEIDRSYLTSNPPFKPTTYSGRKGDSNRMAVMELFTGAQCPPCVAADLAFDGLQKTYKPTDVVLIQYHLHIPGPDPMTNPATEARWAWYRETNAQQMGGVPSTVFNGKPQAGGGGAAAQAERKYTQYRGVIEKLLEDKPGATVKLTANRQGDTVTMGADVTEVADPKAEVKVRFVLAEETIRFVGSNRIRYHHVVVRAMPGGPDGMPITKDKHQHTASVKIGDTRQELIKYLDAANLRRAFPQPERPLAMSNLKAIALVQDEDTGEILQAAVVDLGSGQAGH